MFRIAALLVVAASLAACDMFSTLTNGLSYARAVESNLEAKVGMRPRVGFNWRNGRLVEVSVRFPRLYEAKPLRDVAETVRTAVAKRVQADTRKYRVGILVREIRRGHGGAIIAHE